MEEPLPLSPQSEESGPPWLAMGIAVALLAVAVGVAFIFSRRSPAPAPASGLAPLHPYAAQLRLSDLKMSTAQNFVGATVTYLECKVANGGEKAVSGATVEAIFRNSLGELVQKEAQPLMYVHTRKPYTDVSDLRANPLQPGESRDFRLTFDHVSADWNRELPELRITGVSF
ncbi:MAG: DUF2393 family protein [Terriglobales bacterium]